ncbi:hypothetical protein AVDCRST_MAG84-5371 [uncultured Microcoleus sp.]|uniref:Uncharacterized protein n=1 Tax=uncultured Microcoleus sp. TaxID=259945 RepID=A0A6J4NF90_9CYAN|nr:hypothetical protein AVDCRST_MAG84-5371 [uncultured Microcoleus sp.]
MGEGGSCQLSVVSCQLLLVAANNSHIRNQKEPLPTAHCPLTTAFC